MKIVETFGHYVEKWSESSPEKARRLLKTGWEAQELKFRFLPERALNPSDRYLARMMMDAMLYPLKDPEHCAIVSVFTPCEMLQETGLHPYNVEGFSCYLSASGAERAFLQASRTAGFRKRCAAITRLLSEPFRQGFCQNRNASCTRIWHATQIC